MFPHTAPRTLFHRAALNLETFPDQTSAFSSASGRSVQERQLFEDLLRSSSVGFHGFEPLSLSVQSEKERKKLVRKDSIVT